MYVTGQSPTMILKIIGQQGSGCRFLGQTQNQPSLLSQHQTALAESDAAQPVGKLDTHVAFALASWNNMLCTIDKKCFRYN